MNFLTILPYMELLSRCGLAVRIEDEIPVYRIWECWDFLHKNRFLPSMHPMEFRQTDIVDREF